MSQPAKRKSDLAIIHILKKDLGMDDDAYRAMLWAVARVDSAKDLDPHGRGLVLAHMRAHQAARKPQTYPGRPHNTDAGHRRELKKIEALLTDAGRDWSYAEAIMARQTRGRKQKLEFCDPHELVSIIAALEKEARLRLHIELELVLKREGHTWEHAEYFACTGFNFSSRRTLASYSEAMSQLLRWFRGELSPWCPWPPELH